MAIRLTKEMWLQIRREYEAGATAHELAERYGVVQPRSIHARASREHWRDVHPNPIRITADLNLTSSQVTADRAQAEGITLDAAARLEAIGRNAVVASNRASATLIGKMMSEALHMASLASKDGNHSLAQSAQLLIAAAKEASIALKSKINTDRIAYDIAGNAKSAAAEAA